MKVLITGSAGMLGSAMLPAFRGAGHIVVPTDLRHRDGIWLLDVREQAQVDSWIDSTIDLVLHLAAETSLEVCEHDPEHAIVTNMIGTANVTRATIELGIPIVYIGTAGIFNGEKDGPYTETDQPAPINVYGMSKWLGEKVAAQNPRSFIVRAGWMIGGKHLDHKFVAKIKAQLDAGVETVYAVTDKVGTPTYTKDFAANLLTLIDSGLYGTYHMVCGGSGSRYDVAKEICRILASDVEVVPVDSSYFADEFFAPRPRSEAMVNQALDRVGLNRMRPWQEALEDYLS